MLCSDSCDSGLTPISPRFPTQEPNQAPYKNRDPSPMSLFPSRSVWEALATTYAEAWISQRRSSTHRCHGPRPIAPIASLSRFRAPQRGTEASKFSPEHSTGRYGVPIAAELEQGSVVRQITWSANPEPSSPSLSARGEFPLFPSLFPCFWFVKSCTKTRKRRTPARMRLFRPWRHRRGHCSRPALSLSSFPIKSAPSVCNLMAHRGRYPFAWHSS